MVDLPGRTKWWMLSGIAVGWLILTGVYASWFVQPTSTSTRGFEVLRFVFLSVSAFGVLFSTLLSSFNSLEATRRIADRIHFDRIENSFAFMRRWEESPLVQARDLIRAVEKDRSSLSVDAIRTKVTADHDLERSVVNYFNFVEEVYLSIIANRVDEKLLKDAFNDVFATNYQLFSEAFGRSNRSTATHIQLLHDRWK